MRPTPRLALAAILSALSFTAMAKNPTHQADYQGFTVWLDCKEHAAFKFRYVAGHDMGDYPRDDNFRLDPTVPYECQPTSANSFSTKHLPSATIYHALVLGGADVKVPLHERNIDDLFHRAGQQIGEGLELDYWQAHYGP